MNRATTTTRRTATKKRTTLALVSLWLLLVTLLTAAPAFAQGEATAPEAEEVTAPEPEPAEPDAGSAREEMVRVTFKLNVVGQVPEGKTILVGGGRDEALPSFCSTSPFVTHLTRCEDGGTYSGTAEVPAGRPFSYSYYVLDNASGTVVETFASGTRTFREGDAVSATYTGAGGGSEDDTATLSFELGVECEPPDGTLFFGFVPAEGGIRAQLTDADGDGVYTGSVEVPKYPPGPRPVPPNVESVSLPVQIAQGTDGEISRVIKDFGAVKIDGDKAFEASDASFCSDGGGSDDNGGADGDGGTGGNGDGGSPGGLLPETGGEWAGLLLIGGALLAGAGLLIRRLAR